MYVNIQGDVHVHVDENTDDKPLKDIRNSPKLYELKQKVKKRDAVCQICGEIGTNGHLEIHHIFPVAKYKSLALDCGNMIAICQSCHHKYHNEVGDDVNPITFAKFMAEHKRG